MIAASRAQSNKAYPCPDAFGAGGKGRFAGRVETGRHSVSDPAMGLADRF